MSAIEVNELNVWFGDHHVLKDVSFKVEQNKSFGLVGESGSGKSTVLRTMTGLVVDWEGDIVIDGRVQGTRKSPRFLSTGADGVSRSLWVFASPPYH